MFNISKNPLSQFLTLIALFLVLSGGVMFAQPVRAQSTAEEREQLEASWMK